MTKKTIIAPEAKLENRKRELEPGITDKVADETEKQAHVNALRKAELRQKFVTVADQVAQSNFYYRNFKYPEANSLFPNQMQAHMRTVSKAYPQAKGGMLLVDEPQSEWEMMKAYEKQKVLKKKGFRHIVIQPHIPNKTEATNLADALEQLGEL